MGLVIGITISILYIVGLIFGAWYFNAVPTTANEWGDYFAGFVAPLALVWFIATLNVQRKELSLQRDELKLQREEMEMQRAEMKLSREAQEEQVKVQHETAQAYLEANKIAREIGFHDLNKTYYSYFLNLSKKIYACLPTLADELYEKTGFPISLKDNEYGETKIIDYFANAQSKEFSRAQLIPEITDDLILQYSNTYEEFIKKAKESNGEIYLHGPFFDQYELFQDLPS